MSGVNENITSHQNLIKINLDPSEETRDSFNENFKGLFPKNKEGKVKKHFLDKKMKRTKSKQIKKNSKDNNSKIKIIQKILNDFKISSPLYKEFNQFSKIEKNVKNNLYSHYTQFAKDIRNLLSQYFFLHSNNSEKYKKTLELTEQFEKIYKELENKLFIKESKNHIDIKKRFNKLKKQFRYTLNTNQENNNIYQSNKVKFSFRENNNKMENKNNKKFKINLAKKIRNLTTEQKQGIKNIISVNFLDRNNNIMELDVNKLGENELKILEKYVNRCLNEKNEVLHSETNTNYISPKDEEMFNDLSESVSSDEEY
jgi:hypothetical protein